MIIAASRTRLRTCIKWIDRCSPAAAAPMRARSSACLSISAPASDMCIPQSSARYFGTNGPAPTDAVGKTTQRTAMEAKQRLISFVGAQPASAVGTCTLDILSVPYVGLLTIDNSRRANAISPGMMIQLEGILDQLEKWDDGRAVIVTGAGSAFCGGADLQGSADFLQPEIGAAMNNLMTDVTSRLASLPLISVAAIQGGAVGGGAELATACDFRIMDPSSFIQFVHAKRGLVPGWGGLTRLVRLVGRRQALYLLASAAKMEAGVAAQLGLTDEIVTATPEVPLVQSALEFLRPLVHLDSSEVSTAGLRNVKRLVDEVATITDELDKQYAHESQVFQRLWGGEDHLGAMARWKALRRSSRIDE